MLRKIEATLQGMEVVLPVEPTPDQIASILSEIRAYRNRLTRLMAVLLKRQLDSKTKITRKEHALEQSKAEMLDTGKGMEGCTNDAVRRARIAVSHSRQQKRLLKAKITAREIETALELVKWYRDEFDQAYKEASRQLFAVELDWRMSGGE